jgi:DNA polymerase-3 subunit epsilon
MREIVLDTETTGLDHASGDRLVEIACVELINHVPTGATFQRYINPERAMSEGAQAIHGLSDEFLRPQPRFAEIVDDLLAFIGDAPLVIHNASFDMGFLNMELSRLDRPTVPMARAVDTVAMARRRFPGAKVSLDELCRRFEIDNSMRNLHGALLDARLLADVYLELIGGRQPDLALLGAGAAAAAAVAQGIQPIAGRYASRVPRPHEATVEELAAHALLVAKLKAPLWTA